MKKLALVSILTFPSLIKVIANSSFGFMTVPAFISKLTLLTYCEELALSFHKLGWVLDVCFSARIAKFTHSQ